MSTNTKSTGMMISLSGVLDRTADFLDLHDEPDRAFMIRGLLGHLRELRADPGRVHEFFDLYADEGFEKWKGEKGI